MSKNNVIKVFTRHILKRGMVLVVSFLLVLNLFVLNTSNVKAALDQWENITPVGPTVFNTAATIGDYLFLGTNSGVYRSLNKGQNWTQINDGLSNLNITSITIGWTYDLDNSQYIADDNTPIYISTNNGVYSNTLNGDVWTQVNTGLNDINVSDLEIDQYKALLMANPTTIYSGTIGSSNSGAYRTDDSANWIAINTNLTNKKIIKMSNGTDFGSYAYIYGLTDNNQLYYADMYSMSGSDESWTQTFATTTALNNIDTMPMNTLSYLSTSNGILRGDPNNPWTNSGLNGLNVKTVATSYFDSNDSYAATNNGVYYSIDYSATWKVFNLNLSELNLKDIKTNPLDANTIFAVANNGIYILEMTDPHNLPDTGSDTTVPGKIWDFNATSANGVSINLVWTAPGDDGDSGTASSYEIRYATSTYTFEYFFDWNTAHAISNPPIPKTSGQLESYNFNVSVPNLWYHFAIKTSDEVPNVSEQSVVASAYAEIDSAAPVISNIASTTTSNSATTTWTTNEPATSQINYGLTSNYTGTTTLDTNLIASHSVNITGLTGNTIYHYRIRTADASGNVSISVDYIFKTLATADLNSDGHVNSVDVSMLMFYWGSNARPRADINQDGYVNSQDAAIMMSQWIN